ncbi:MAG: hypothetical protein F6K09_08265 [Merismopedia sp. SIO2A8]|nr:hypothetical protein [Merismopedia sp. SIO2A8]
MVFKGRTFTKKETFAARLRHLAVELAEESLSIGKPCIVVDCQSHITLWRAEQTPIGVKTQPQPGNQMKKQRQRSRSRAIAKAS